MRPCAEVAQTEGGGGIVQVFQRGHHPVERGMKFIPQSRIRREGDFSFKSAAAIVPAHGNLCGGDDLWRRRKIIGRNRKHHPVRASLAAGIA